MSTPLPLVKDESSKNCFFVPLSYFEKLNKQGTIPNEISFGTNTAACEVVPHSHSEKWLLSANLWEILSIPFETSVHVIHTDDMLHIGPLIGIFTAGFTNQPHRPLGARSFLFAKYLTSAQSVGGYYFMFGSHQINWESGKIHGLYYTKEGWEKHSSPFPHVVYDRIPNRRAEKLPILQDVKKRMENDYFIPWFNSGFFNKWSIYEKLQTNDAVSSYLPETILNPSIQEIENLLDKYQHIYVKPADGSLGIGVHHIIKRCADNHYYCRFRKDEKNLLQRYKNLNELIESLFNENRLETMVAQQGITLLKMDKRPLDFRIHANKDIDGKWRISAIAAKISGRNSVTTHIASGGKVKTVHELSAENESFPPLIKKLQQAALTLSKAFDENIDGYNGEIGFDMGIDVNGKIWLFEANSKPGRSIFTHPRLKKEEFATRKLPFEYGVFLAETALTKPGLILS